ncbi:DUF3102 domain-containing protein [Staphylococcus nepalensis]|uniref:DUF3102 domain-containing protein n=1 Tax=Staphylococcus nepalensis TaxID=214473 RepID=UPI0035141258
MNEVQLSDNLTTIETEIKSYQNIAGQSIFEIGRRLKHVKENDLAHGEFGKWLERIDMDKSQASRFIKIIEEHGNKIASTQIPMTILYEISTLPFEERNKEHTTLNGETKKPEEMSSKEIRDLKQQLKKRDEENSQLESQLEQSQRSESIALKQLEDEQNKEPEVIERYMEPEDYHDLKKSNNNLEEYIHELSNQNQKLKTDIDNLKQEQSEVDGKSQKYDQLNEEINKMNGRLSKGQQQIKAQKEIYDLVKGSEKVIREVAPLCYLAFSKDIIDNDYARKPIEKIIDDLTDMANRLRKQMNQGEIIDV